MIGYAETAQAACIQAKYVEFCTVMTDGNEVCTNNSSVISSFRTVPEKTVLQFPQVDDPVRLYTIHEKLLPQYANVVGKQLPLKGNEVEALCDSMAADCARQIETGYLYVDETGECYRPTWKGAFLMTWKQLPPVSHRLRVRIRRRARRLLKELGG